MSDTDLELLARRALGARFPAPAELVVLEPLALPSRRGARTAVAAVAVAVVVLCVSVAVAVWPRPSSKHLDGATGSLDDATRARITRFVRDFEHAVGDRVARVEVVRSTRHHAVLVTMGDGVQGAEPVWVVQLTAATVFHMVTTGPKGANTTPTVKYAVVVLDARTFQSNDTSIGDRHADLSSLGPVTSFKP